MIENEMQPTTIIGRPRGGTGRLMLLAAEPPRLPVPPTPSTTIDQAELAAALTIVRRTAEIRAERVAVLQARIKAGTYYVPDSLLAQRMLDFQS
jgi:hypothetical protein